MEYVGLTLVLLVCLSPIFGAIYLFYWAVRCFMAKRVKRGIWALMFLVLLGFSVVFVGSGIRGAKEIANRACCGSDLKQIVLFLKMYAADHQESYPSTFNELATTNLVKAGDAVIFVGTSSHQKVGALTNIQEWTDYAYVSGLADTDPANCVVMFCLPENHKGEGANVAFIGGQVMWFPCQPYANDGSVRYNPTFQELTNTPSLFYGTSDEAKLADLKKRTRIIYPKESR